MEICLLFIIYIRKNESYTATEQILINNTNKIINFKLILMKRKKFHNTLNNYFEVKIKRLYLVIAYRYKN